MKLAVLHYHLNRGGVTKVIENHLRALDAVLPEEEAWEAAILYGGRREGWNESLPQQLRAVRPRLHAVPLVEYDAEQGDTAPRPDALADALVEVLKDLDFSPEETVVHVHNHALGKNISLPGAVMRLAAAGYRLLLQHHDFAEDFRPENFRNLQKLRSERGADSVWHGELYPQAPHVHYAVLNGRDESILHSAGVAPERVHLLPNPVLGIDNLPPREQARRRLAGTCGVGAAQRFVLYPTRCIRRKNVGEALLHGVLAAEGTVVGMTLPPLNPDAVPVYRQWKALAEELDLPCRFELGAPGGLGFAESLAAADLILTTSVAEGFGMVFLESWLAGRMLVGRDLPEITADFARAGVSLDHLHPRLGVPVEWVGLEAFHRAVVAAYHRTLAAYDWPQPPGEAEALDAKTADGLVDFADLDESQQQQVIRLAAGSDSRRQDLLEANAWCSGVPAGSEDSVPHLISANAAAIDRRYSLAPSGNRLLEVYRRVVCSPCGHPLGPLPRAHRILDQFLALRRFRLIRS